MVVEKYSLASANDCFINVQRLHDRCDSLLTEQFLGIEVIGGIPYMLCLSDQSKPSRDINIVIVSDDDNIPFPAKKDNYLGSYVIGDVVNHVFYNPYL